MFSQIKAFLIYALVWACHTGIAFCEQAFQFRLAFSAVKIGTNNYNGDSASIQGMKKLTNINSSRKVDQFPIKEIDINANTAPMTQLVEKLGRHYIVQQDVYNWVERDALLRTVTTAASQTTSGSYDIQAATTSIDLLAGHGNAIIVYQVLLVERTGEMVRVTAKPSTDTLTVTRGYAGTSAAIIAASSAVEELRILAPAFPEGSAAPAGVTVEPVVKQAYPQTVRKSIGGSRRDINSENYGEMQEWKRQSELAIDQMQSEKERVCLMQPGANTSDATATKGARGYISTNLVNQAGPLDEGSIDSLVKVTSRRNNSNKKNLYAFSGEIPQSAMNGFARDYLRLVSDDTKLGLEVSVFRSAFGEMKLINHPELNVLSSSVTAANAGTNGWIFFINVSLCGIVHFKGGDLFLDEHTETNGTDGRQDTWTEDFGFFMQNELAHSLMYGVTG